MLGVGGFSDRAPTGINVLDELIGGGLPRGGLILVAGNPGSGKTIFSAQFVHHGAERLGEVGIYVSFSESRETFMSNMSQMGFKFDELEKAGKFRLLDFPVMSESGVATTLESVLRQIGQFKARRLVIDSFSAMAQAYRGRSEARIVLHTILSKMTRQAGCTTLLIVEVPTGQEKLGTSVEEFVADGIFILGREKEFGIRQFEIPKLRGSRIQRVNQMFTLADGFQVMESFSLPKISRKELWRPISDSDTHFSSGSGDLDRALGGGYQRGASVVLEAEPSVPLEAIQLLSMQTAWNFLSRRKGVFILPTMGVSKEEYAGLMTPHIEEGAFDKCVTVYSDMSFDKSELEPFRQHQLELRKRTGGPILTIVGYDLLESSYANEMDQLFSMVGRSITECKLQGDLTLALTRPGLEITQRTVYLTDQHVRLIERNGCIFLYGVKPRTPLYALGCDISKGFPRASLKPVV